MQRQILSAALVVLLTALAGELAAQPHTHSGDCSFCHTMHNSQDNLPMRYNEDASPLPKLLRGDCVVCHTGMNSPVNLAATTAKVSRSAATQKLTGVVPGPRVMAVTPPTYSWGDSSGLNGGTLAGGSFYWTASNDAYGHNVTDIPGIQPDIRLGTTPPGGSAMAGPLQCAGINGCHGNSEIADQLDSLEKAHHTNIQGDVDGTTVGRSYRFLRGVRGVEDADWEWTVNAEDHNRYAGEARKVETTPPSAATMSGFCARCHGDFHNASSGKSAAGEGGPSGFASPWVRHPNDYDMAVSGDYATYSTYASKAPVARSTATMKAGSDSAVVPNQRIIMCLTCHRAHGSPYYAMLRWNYRGWPGPGGQDGCQICHTSKF